MFSNVEPRYKAVVLVLLLQYCDEVVDIIKIL